MAKSDSVAVFPYFASLGVTRASEGGQAMGGSRDRMGMARTPIAVGKVPVDLLARLLGDSGPMSGNILATGLAVRNATCEAPPKRLRTPMSDGASSRTEHIRQCERPIRTPPRAVQLHYRASRTESDSFGPDAPADSDASA